MAAIGNAISRYAMAASCPRLGAHVVLSGRDATRGEEAVAAIRAQGGSADFVAVDLSDADSARFLAQRAAELGGGHVGILINNAGIFPFGAAHDTAEDDFDKVFAVNVKAPFFLVPKLAPAMAKRGQAGACAADEAPACPA
jgi:NAD(P)-dependent dehydrogenase (short-subunit alcohol dehydrogenase family)